MAYTISKGKEANMVNVRIISKQPAEAGTARILKNLQNLGADVWWNDSGSERADVILSRVRGDEPDLKQLLSTFTSVVEYSPDWVRIINPPHAVYAATSKKHQVSTYKAGKIPTPRTLKITNSTNLAQVIKFLGLPLMIKRDAASNGDGVFWVNGATNLENVIKEHEQESLLAQEYIPEGSRTLSMIVIKSQVVASAISVAQTGKWKTNEQDGGMWSGYYPDFSQSDLAVHACEYLGVDIGEVETVITPKGPLVLCVDPSPHLKIIERVTNINVAELIAKFCLGK